MVTAWTKAVRLIRVELQAEFSYLQLPVQKLPCSAVSFPAEAKPPGPTLAVSLCSAQPPECSGPPPAWARLSASTEGRGKSLPELSMSFQSGSTKPEVVRAYFILIEGFLCLCRQGFPNKKQEESNTQHPGVEPEDGACRAPALQCSETLR